MMYSLIAFQIVGCLVLSIPQLPSPFGKAAFVCFFVELLLFVGALSGVGGLHLR